MAASARSAQSTTKWIAVDWGTSNVRFWAVSSEGEVLHAAKADAGSNSLKSDEFEACLLAHVESWLNPEGLTDVVICGMAGSRTGWQEAPYANITADISEIAGNAINVPCNHKGLTVWILPGLSQHSPPDIIRGEETQLAGLLRREPEFNGWVVMPGTHSKWIDIEGGRLQSSRTAMTGEIFALLKTHSILRHSLDDNVADDVAADPSSEPFLRGVKLAWSDPHAVLPAIFQVRAADILANPEAGSGNTSASDRAAQLSGLLIGWELSSILLGKNNTAQKSGADDIVIVGSKFLGAAYETALSSVGITSRQVDGMRLVLDGLKAAHAELTSP